MKKNTNNNQVPEKAIQLLPWYAMGLLTPEENNYIEKKLLEHPELQMQLKEEHETIHFLKEEEDLFYLSKISSSENRLEQILKRKILTTNKLSIKDKLVTFIRSLVSGNLAGTQYVGFAVISTISIALLFAFVAPLLNQQNTFYPANSHSSDKSHALKTPDLLIGLNINSDDPRLLLLLKDIKAKANSIPGKKGMISINFINKPSPSELKKAIKKLSANKELIWFVGEAY
jgi:hypothetical protein